MIQPHRQMFEVESGVMFSRRTGVARECFFIAIPGRRCELAQQVEATFGKTIVLARNEKLSMDYLVSNRPSGSFSSEDIEQIRALWGFHIHNLRDEP